MKKLLSLIIVITILSTTIAYSSLSTTLNVKGEANVRAPSSIRVVGIKQLSNVNTTENYNPKYTKNTISTSFNLLDNTSSITYTVTIKNSSNEDMMIKSINSNTNIYKLDNYNLYDIIKANSTKDINITYKGIGNIDSNIEFIFDKYAYKVTYNALDGKFNDESVTNTLKVHFDGKNNNIVEGIIYNPIKDNSLFSNWYIDKEYTTLFDITKPITKDIEVFAKYIDYDLNIKNNKTIISTNTILKEIVPKKINVLNSYTNINNIIFTIDYEVDNDEELLIKVNDKSNKITLSKEDNTASININNISISNNSIFTIETLSTSINNENSKITNFYLEIIN